MNFFHGLLGRLSPEYLPHEPITLGAAIGMPLMVLVAAIFVTKKKLWSTLWNDWFTSVDAKKIGVMYMIVAILMLIRGVFDAAMLRTQTAISHGDQHGPFQTDTFQQVFTAHGTIMIFFVAMGLMIGLINVVLPLMLGARDMAFPMLNSISLWLFVAGMMLANVSLILGGFSNAGWLGYPPLSELQYNPGPGIDYWIWSLQIAGVGTLLSAINFMTTILKKRAPGMTLGKMPVFSWSVLVTTALMILAFPVLTATLGMLSLDRTLGMHFFTSFAGGNPMMYINLIWAWGHPEVYILVLPAFGIFSEIVPVFAKKALFGYKTMVAALIAIMFLSFLVWQHHFFTMGAGEGVNAFFGIMTMVIAIPTGVKIFNWLFTMFRGRIRFASPMVWFLAFVFTFTLGGVSGVILSVPALDYQMHNSLFLVAHFHNTIIGGVIFGYMAGMMYWFPKIFGFRLNDRLGRYSAYAWQIGFILAFMPLYVLGWMGAVRRIDHYTDPSWVPFFIVSGVGVMVVILGVGLNLLQFAVSYYQREKLRDTTGDPWDGRTLEWSVPSPAPHYNFAITPLVSARDDWWEQKRRGVVMAKSSDYKAITLPKNTPVGIIVGVMAGLAGFAIIWYIWWLAVAALIVIIVTVILRSLNDDSEYVISASELRKLDRRARGL